MIDGYTRKSTEPIQRNEANTNNIMMPLIAFNGIVDIEIGLIRLIAKKYLDPKMFDIDFLVNSSIRDLVKKLYTRENPNPLTVISNAELSELDELYDDFITNYYDEILQCATETELFSQIMIWREIGNIHSTILCRNSTEMDFLKRHKLLSKMQAVTISDAGLDLFPQYYFKSINDSYIETISNKDIKAKTVYIARYQFNLSKDKEGSKNNKKEAILFNNYITRILSNPGNQFRTFDIYNRNKLFQLEENHA
jgi:hypothetical protein